MLKKTSFWVAIAAVALVGLSLSGGSVAFADPPCPTGVNPPCPPGKGGTPPAGASGQGLQNQQGAGEGQRHGAFGVVSQKDDGSPTIWTLLTKQGEVDITTDGSTVCKDATPGGPTAGKCANIHDGYYVSVQGTPDGDGGILAKRVNLNRGRSLHEHCRGDITAIAGSTITVACRTDGETFSRIFTVGVSTKFGPSGVDGLGNLAVGDEVMVVAARDGLLASDLYTAKVVHKVAD